jgi:histidine ammonia-lyase
MAILKSHYPLEELAALWKSAETVELSATTQEKIRSAAQWLPQYLQQAEAPVYGVNTGFGSLQNVRVPDSELRDLQYNLLITHAAGFGPLMDSDLVRLMLLLKVLNISHGHSAVRLEVVDRLLWFYNHGYTPVVHSQGSLGASGDLAPLAEMCLPLLGQGLLHHSSEGTQPADAVLKAHGLHALVLEPKEALALINGTQFMLAHAVQVYDTAQAIMKHAVHVAAISADVYLCRREPFFPQLHAVRPHPGQVAVAAQMLELLKGSPLEALPRPAVQDPYSFRCIPQVHGASADALHYCFGVWETELNSVTDNPIVFEEDNLILSGGNFHGQPLALTLDYAAMALAELASISERRIYLLISGQRGLPPFLSPNPGTDSGYMIAQYSAAAAVSQNKQLCTPASVDSIVSSNGQEDHVSMGANAAIKCLQVVANVKQVLATEFLCAAQAASFREGSVFASGQTLVQALSLPQDAHFHDPMWLLEERTAKVLFG